LPSARFVSVAVACISIATLAAQPAAPTTTERLLIDRLSLPQADVARMQAGEAVAWKLAANAPNEVGGAGAIRAKGDHRRLVAWFRDIEAFMRAAGTENVGVIHSPATPADFARLNLDDVEFADLQKCRPGKCDVRMPESYLSRFQTEITWTAPDAGGQAARLAKQMLGEYVRSYQDGGDAALGAHHDQKDPAAIANGFKDMLRRATKVWDLAYPLASYLETFPKGRPEGAEDHFYWTRDKLLTKQMLTLHHVVLQELPAGRVLLADKQFYASRQVDEALMVALLVPTADAKGFDLIVAVRARAEAAGGVTGRMLRGRIESDLIDGLKTYLEWIKASSAL
jgi:hypothetical protein